MNIDFRLPIEEYVELFQEPRTYKGCLLEAEKLRNRGLGQEAATIEKLVTQLIAAETRILRLLGEKENEQILC